MCVCVCAGKYVSFRDNMCESISGDDSILFKGAFVLSKKLQETLSLSPLRSRDFLLLLLSLDDDVFFDDKLAKN